MTGLHSYKHDSVIIGLIFQFFFSFYFFFFSFSFFRFFFFSFFLFVRFSFFFSLFSFFFSLIVIYFPHHPPLLVPLSDGDLKWSIAEYSVGEIQEHLACLLFSGKWGCPHNFFFLFNRQQRRGRHKHVIFISSAHCSKK